MKELPDETTLLELLELAKFAEEKAKALYDLATEIDEKWRMKLEKRRQESIVQSVGSK
jgi:endonuclease III